MRPTWDEYFMRIAWVVKDRSHDEETKHGAVIVLNKKIIATGYNGWQSGVDLPEEYAHRPKKYQVMRHAEKNALAHMTIKQPGATVYVTGKPCCLCLTDLAHEGIYKVVMLDRQGTKLESEETNEAFNLIVQKNGIELVKYPMEILNF